jgi:hypothetical protein
MNSRLSTLDPGKVGCGTDLAVDGRNGYVIVTVEINRSAPM